MTKIRYGTNKKKRVMRIVREIQTRIDRNCATTEDRSTLDAIKAGTY